MSKVIELFGISAKLDEITDWSQVVAEQSSFLHYIKREFQFEHINNARVGDPMHIHSYHLSQNGKAGFRLGLASRFSTDTEGVAKLLGLQADANIELEEIIEQLERKISTGTLFTI